MTRSGIRRVWKDLSVRDGLAAYQLVATWSTVEKATPSRSAATVVAPDDRSPGRPCSGDRPRCATEGEAPGREAAFGDEQGA